MSSRGAPPQMLTGPGAAGMHAEPMTPKERDRHYRERDREREREREKERESQSRSIERRERERAEVAAAREREREMFEAERNEREKAHRWEREQRREEEKRAREQRRESHDFMSGMLGGGDRMSEAEREREWMMRNPHLSNMGRMEQPNWSRFAQPREDPREREQREMERQMEREREREMLRRREEEMRAREQMDAERMNRQVSRREREREAREKERIRDVAAKDANRERTEKSRRTQGEDHGWLPDPRAPAAEGWIKDAERERERQLQMRFQQEREREFHEREFAREREREEMEAMRNRHPASHHHHHLHHHHHRHPAPPSSIPGHPPGHIVSTKSKMGRQIELQDGIIGPGAGLPAPFDKVVTTLPPPPGHKHSKTPIATTPSQPLPPQMMPEHFHPSNHLLMPPTRPPLGFQDFRPTSPPFKNALTAPRPNIPMQSRSPRPPLMPTLKPRTLGTFVHPRLPFPFLDFPMPSGAEETREIHASLLIPSGFIPVAKPRHPRIWGGALIPSFSPFFANPLLMTHAQAGMPYGFARPLPHEIHGVRRVYTDDSDMFLCALHAGWITWSIARKARAEGKDLRLEVRLSRESRYPGGLGSKFMGAVDGQEVSREDDGSTLLSAGWGNSHDGAGVEILHAEFVKAGTARKLGLRNRSQRISEYSERASSLGCMSAVRKRRRVDPVSDDDIEEYDLAGAPDADVCASRTVVLGYRRGSSKVGFKYNCEVVKRILFPAEEPPRKKAKLSDANALQMDVDDEPAPASRVSHKGPSIVVETLAETFLIHPQEDSPGSEDKENADGGLRYTISLVHVTQPPPPSPEKAVDTESTPDQATATQSAQHADAAAEPSVPASDEKGPAPATTEAAPKEAEVFTNAQLPVESKPDEAPAAPDASSSDPAPAAIAGPNPEPPKTVDGEAKSVDGAADAPKEGDEPTKDQPVESDKAAPTESKATPAESQPPEAKPVEPAKEQSAAAEEDVSMADATSEPAPSKTPLTTLEVLQRNAAQADLLFDDDGISVLSNQVENGMRKGWKLEARSWRWASAELTAIAS
ncbi:hypothetical protein PsYK624_100400 [Phanerochaete sordida]|uniref:Uncharacterized protein n=1 Tax=Phanerochaete sordida TaxID=48140 RepID=A0A9P3GFF6_9APHY|nr:hypothetical protein PsYK624_100400 [Phanerochaete sordida]